MNKELLRKIRDVLHFSFKTLLYVIFVFMIFIIFVIVCYVIGVQKNAKSGKYEPPIYSAYIIVSPSMEPTIKVNDAIIVKRIKPKRIKKGDIITFISSDPTTKGITITHRVVEILEDSDHHKLYRTKGDNNNVVDSTLVKEDDLSGKVIMKIPKIGYIQWFVSTKFGWIIAVALPCMGIIIYDIIKVVEAATKGLKYKKKKDR